MAQFEIFIKRQHTDGTLIPGFEWVQVIKTLVEVVEALEGEVAQNYSEGYPGRGRTLVINIHPDYEADLRRDIAQVLKGFGVEQ